MAESSWRQAVSDARRAAVEVARLQARELKAIYQDRTQRSTRTAKLAHRSRIGDPSAATGQYLDVYDNAA